MALKSLPNNLEAEESVLGACFLSKYALQKANGDYSNLAELAIQSMKYFGHKIRIEN